MLVQRERNRASVAAWTGEQYFVPAESLLAEWTITANLDTEELAQAIVRALDAWKQHLFKDIDVKHWRERHQQESGWQTANANRGG